jgi:hypothetical protein
LKQHGKALAHLVEGFTSKMSDLEIADPDLSAIGLH